YINDPTTFSASVTSTTGNFDSVIALFNDGGYGLYGNDDAKLGFGDAGLPAGSLLGPQASGWYHLAVFSIATAPTSGNDTTPANWIAPETSFPFTSIISASGPGGASPLTGWAPVEHLETLNEEYTIGLASVSVVPEPETYAMLLAGLGLMGAMARRRKVFTAY
ncbi:MAG: PEP-CTERM sorting domain-containing protein, partial [Nitrosospira sp.]|nr:PEP-CTERM sorting domain-containing protein [Nitrosospira sp.]